MFFYRLLFGKFFVPGCQCCSLSYWFTYFQKCLHCDDWFDLCSATCLCSTIELFCFCSHFYSNNLFLFVKCSLELGCYLDLIWASHSFELKTSLKHYFINTFCLCIWLNRASSWSSSHLNLHFSICIHCECEWFYWGGYFEDLFFTFYHILFELSGLGFRICLIERSYWKNSKLSCLCFGKIEIYSNVDFFGKMFQLSEIDEFYLILSEGNSYFLFIDFLYLIKYFIFLMNSFDQYYLQNFLNLHFFYLQVLIQVI